jgi:hypothetical protein
MVTDGSTAFSRVNTRVGAMYGVLDVAEAVRIDPPGLRTAR